MLRVSQMLRAVIALHVMTALLASAADAQVSPGQLAQSIDDHIDRRLKSESIEVSPPIDDTAFLRRVTLDLAGRIPTAAEWEAFKKDESVEKRRQVIQRLIDLPDFAYHQRNEIDLLLQRSQEYNSQWREYLLEATFENRGWDQLFREVVTPDLVSPDDQRPTAFLAKRIKDLDTITNDASILWFGVNIACAKCHDHPLVLDWTQAHYYGLASFFKRTYRGRNGSLGERFDGNLKYTDIYGDEHQAKFQFLTGAVVEEPESNLNEARLKELEQAIKKAEREDSAEPPPQPEFRPRTELVEIALAERSQSFFAHNIVNRTWARLLGRGLVHPLDQMHSENPPSHPELLNLLSDDLIANGYDLRRLVHSIVLTKVYSRPLQSVSRSDEAITPASNASNTESATEASGGQGDMFAAAKPRPLSPHQLSLSYRIATANPDQLLGWTDPESWTEQRRQLEQRSESVARQLAIPAERFQVPISEALWFSNNPSVHNDYLNASRARLVGHLQTIDDDIQVIQQATRSVLSRDPRPEEISTMLDYLAARLDRRTAAVEHLVWALLSTPEFRFNH